MSMTKSQFKFEHPLFQEGMAYERERIIELLEDECAGDWPKFVEMSLEHLIALIKGEK